MSITGMAFAAANALALAYKDRAYGYPGRDYMPEEPVKEVLPPVEVELHTHLPDGVREDDPDWERVKVYTFSRAEVDSDARPYGKRLRMLGGVFLEVADVTAREPPLVLEALDERHFYTAGMVWECVD